MGSPLVPAFVVERQAGLVDFWTVYQQLIEHSPETAIEAAFRVNDLPPLARAPADELAGQARRCRALLADAMSAGDWQPYVDEIRSLGARCAALGVKFASWYAVAQALRERLIPALVEAYASAPVRLADAIEAALAWIDFSMARISEPYLETSHLNQIRVLADADRRSLEDRFRALAGATPDAIVTADHRGQITYVNHATEALFGRSAVALLGQPLTVLMPPRLREAHAQGLARYLKTREPRVLGKTLEMPALRSDGTEIAIELSITTWAARGETSFAAIIRDISERKRIAATLEQRTRLLEATNRELEAFSYSVAHDLRAPLRAIDGFSQALLEDFGGKLNEVGRSYLTRVRVNAQRMAGLIDDLLELSRVARWELRREPVDLAAIARESLGSLQRAEPNRAVEIAIAGDTQTTGDPKLLAIVFDNLCGNAWKFTSKRTAPRIEIGAEPAAAGRVFYVRDNGVGFDPKYTNKLFGVFQRLHAEADFPGTGIGLATVQRIVERHGGRVWAEGKVGDGATFYFTLGEP